MIFPRLCDHINGGRSFPLQINRYKWAGVWALFGCRSRQDYNRHSGVPQCGLSPAGTNKCKFLLIHSLCEVSRSNIFAMDLRFARRMAMNSHKLWKANKRVIRKSQMQGIVGKSLLVTDASASCS